MPITVGTLVAYLDLDANPFTKNLSGAMRKAESEADRMKRVGADLSRNLTLPLAAAGVAATKMSLDFEQTFSRMQGLAGVSAEEVEGLKEAVMGLAGETGRGPQELAEALYFVRSSGLAGKDALDALEMSAKGAAAGLGSTVAVADAVTSAMNGYGVEVLSAAEATDVLVATAREGKAEASELAPQFGRLIPVASELGISFDQVGAGLAYLSRSSGDASLSATQLDGVMQKLIKPSQQGAEALSEVGMSTDSIRSSIDEDGLLDTLLLLRERLGDSGFVRFFDDVQGLQGALALTRAEGEMAIPVFDALGNAAGSTESAFAAWAETMGAKNQKAFAQLQSSMIQLGDVLVPIVAKVAEVASAVLEWFMAMDDGSKQVVVAFGIMLAAMGPAITIGTRLAAAVKALGTAYQWAQVQSGLFAAGGLRAMTAGGPAAIAALAAVGAAVNQYGSEMRRAKEQASEWAEGFAGDFDPAKASMSELQAEIARLNGAADEWQQNADNAISPFKDGRYKAARDDLREMVAPLEEIASQAAIVQQEMGLSAEEALRVATNTAVMEAATDNATGAFDDEAAAIALATGQLQGYADELAKMFDPLFAMQDALNAEATARFALTVAVTDHGRASIQAMEAQDALTRAMVETDTAALKLQEAVIAGDVSMDEFRERLAAWVTQGRYTQEQADELAGRVGWLTGVAEGYAKPYTATFVADTSTAEGRIAALKHSIATVPKFVPVGFIGPLLPGQQRTPGPVQKRAQGGAVWPGQDFLVGEEGPELVRFLGSGAVIDAATTRDMLYGPPVAATVDPGRVAAAGAAAGATTIREGDTYNVDYRADPVESGEEGLYRALRAASYLGRRR